jgi:hypothetical protein
MNKEKIMLIAGCSHAAGSEINGQEDSVYNRQHSFGARLADKMGYRPINIATNGASNSCIARSILNWFDQNYDENSMDVFVLTSWTESVRLEVPSTRNFIYNVSSKAADWFDNTINTYFRITFGWDGGDPEEKELFPKYHRFMAENEPMLEMWSANYVLQIQYFLKSKNVKYLMCNAMHMFTKDSPHVAQITKLIDRNNYYKLDSEKDDAFFWKYKNLGYTNPKAKYWHHDEVPHQLYAEELYNFLKENNNV